MKWNTGFPEKSGEYVVFMAYGAINTLHYSSKHKVFNSHDYYSEQEANELSMNKNVLKWIELNEFLKAAGLAEQEEKQHVGKNQSA